MSDVVDTATLDLVFGPGSGGSLEARAATSKRIFVRGLDQLTVDDRPAARGRRLTAREALAAYGFDVLREAVTEGSALICETPDAAGRVLRTRREELGLEVRQVANRSGLAPATVETLEASKRRPIREYERVARVLGLDERMISFRSEPLGNDRLAVRLRTLSDTQSLLTASTVAALAEAAWVAMTQSRLEQELGIRAPRLFSPVASFGSAKRPAYKVGYELADSVRHQLKLGTAPISSMRELAERGLGITVIQTTLNERIAGATVEAGDRRAIVLNLAGRNDNVYVRRSTLAHELGHLLFDPPADLRELRVDAYSDLDRRPDELPDPVEQRANAFAVQLLAPQSAAVATFLERGLGDVLDEFGISFTAARYQIWNGLERRRLLDEIDTPQRRPAPDWEAREAYKLSYHPLRALMDFPARAGRFSALCVRAAERGIISFDTAGEWLVSTEPEVRAVSADIRELYPDVWGS